MFDTQAIGKKISTLRKQHNMTQMQLADAMMVSYQAVSNWERGNSMPDISKLPELADIFGITIDELLGNTTEAKFVESIAEEKEEAYIEEKEVTMKELGEIATILPPSKTEELAEIITENQIKISELICIAPFVSNEFLSRAILQCERIRVSELVGLVPFLEEETLNEMLPQIVSESTKVSELVGLAPFVSSAFLGQAILKCGDVSVKGLVGLAPFLDEEDLYHLIENLTDESVSMGDLICLAPFLDSDIVAQLTMKLIKK